MCKLHRSDFSPLQIHYLLIYLFFYFVFMKQHCFQLNFRSVCHQDQHVSTVSSRILLQKSLKFGFNSGFLWFKWPLHLNIMGKDYNLKLIKFVDNISFSAIDITKHKSSQTSTPYSTAGQKFPAMGNLSGNFIQRLSYSTHALHETFKVPNAGLNSTAPNFPSLPLTQREYSVWQSWCES